ncbi:elongation factor G [Qiania dongpingensis]|uniref:TetM/TetW/TetO/TetS family tetracycline resistance ribosomal protection protein n=1 Tax=Qiania dongpingensis TaxID=2763669 RepID=A0A7G9G347_9FIRM|nr:TetM/TetW/TetO/TetS family tetracycline resistance ribosomal protection protein [Qiania dongpingensis]QNM05229.1 TetM/TetW/TetO/TetS family tetracycline resistance ribosomal protection protein [Qiania dongpingensis]
MDTVVGMLAHVDAGKTTLTEAMLYEAGMIRKRGRVDRGDAFLDSSRIERERGITVFSRQAALDFGGRSFILLDTPGHVDFAGEMERVLDILDYGILVVDGNAGIQGHTKTIWRLLKKKGLPVFLFINKMDREGIGEKAILKQLETAFGAGFVPASLAAAEDGQIRFSEEMKEEITSLEDEVLEEYLEGKISELRWLEIFRRQIRERLAYPCLFGAALSGDGVPELLSLLAACTDQKEESPDFGAKVYKILHDDQGNRITFLRLTGGMLHVKDIIRFKGEKEEEKVNQIRLYSGDRYQTVQEIRAGTVAGVTGLTRTRPGQGLGYEEDGGPYLLCPVMAVQVLVKDGTDSLTALKYLHILEEEEPGLAIRYQRETGEIQASVMGTVQLEILKALIMERFHMEIEFGPCRVLYQETIAGPVMGYGHYEPLRHYAEVHLLLRPGGRGQGIRAFSDCSQDELDGSYQRLILHHILEKEHRGILTGAPLTDVDIILKAGRAHLKHTEGGDFREAVYRAVRQGLEKAETILLEPWYRFEIEVPEGLSGKVMMDIQKRNGTFLPPESGNGRTVICGRGPVSEFMEYPLELASLSRGDGTALFQPDGYAPCHDQEEAAAASGYVKERDLENPSCSIFCSHGAGYEVKWYDVDRMRHIKG